MKNKEKYIDELMDIIINGRPLAINKQTNRPVQCNNKIDCVNCLFYEMGCNDEGRKEWLEQEYHEPILDEKEREYLSAVIRPWRDKVTDIIKTREWETEKKNAEFIRISLDDDGIVTDLPYFKAGTMYKGMELDREYSLEDLGL